MTLEAAISVACTFCGAKPGDLCRSANSGELLRTPDRENVHKARKEKWELEYMKDTMEQP